MKITEALMAEHVVFHNLFDYIEKTAPAMSTLAEVKALSNLMEFMLVAHSQAEDKLLIEPLEPSFSQLGHDEHFHAEHDEINHHLADMRQAQDLDQAKDLLLKAVVGSRKHFDKEERLVFPLAESQLSENSQQLLGKQWARQRNVFMP
jgi:hemerythrin-like domain-containing protein